MKALRTLDAARAVCEFTKWTASNLSMHKTLYIAHGTYMAEKNSPDDRLIDGDFEAWKYGPVLPDLYQKFKIFGADRIEEYALTLKDPTTFQEEGDERVEHIKKVVGWLKDMTPGKLVAITHNPQGAWDKSYAKGAGVVIPHLEIFNEYRR